MLGTDVTLRGVRQDEQDLILTPGALAFVGGLARAFRKRFDGVLAARSARRDSWRAGNRLEFADQTASVRNGEWSVGAVPRDLQQRIVELTGPVEAQSLADGLASGADVFVADFEDSVSPTWTNSTKSARRR